MHVLKVLVFTAACSISCVALGTNVINNACMSICIGLEVSYVHLSFSASHSLPAFVKLPSTYVM